MLTFFYFRKTSSFLLKGGDKNMYFIIETHLMEKVLIHSFSELILFNFIKKSKGLVCNHISSFLKNYDVIALKVVAFMYIFLGNKIT